MKNDRVRYCFRCHCEWLGNAETPKQCTTCGSRRYHEVVLPQKLACKRCGYEWIVKELSLLTDTGLPSYCPQCAEHWKHTAEELLVGRYGGVENVVLTPPESERIGAFMKALNPHNKPLDNDPNFIAPALSLYQNGCCTQCGRYRKLYRPEVLKQWVCQECINEKPAYYEVASVHDWEEACKS